MTRINHNVNTDTVEVLPDEQINMPVPTEPPPDDELLEFKEKPDPTEEEKLRAALIKAIEIIEEISEHEGRGEIIGLKDLKKAAGLIVTAEVVSLGIHKGYYLFEERRADGVVKQFLCNPDDVDFYNLCLPKAVEMDSNPKIRAKRLQALADFESEKPPNVLKSVDEAVMPL